MRENYNIIQIEVSCGYSFGSASSHEIRVWFDGMDLNNQGYIEHIPLYKLQEKGIIKRGYSFKKSKEFYNSIEGKKWVGDYLKNRDLERQRNEIDHNIRCRLNKLNKEQLEQVLNMINNFK